jgi:hypothetical protein
VIVTMENKVVHYTAFFSFQSTAIKKFVSLGTVTHSTCSGGCTKISRLMRPSALTFGRVIRAGSRHFWAQSKTQFEGPTYASLGLNLRKKLMKCYIWSIALYGAGTWTLRKTGRKYLEGFEMRRWSRMETSWKDRVKNDVLHGVKE